MRNKFVHWTLIFSITLLLAGMATNASAGWVETNKNGDVTYFSDGKIKSTSRDDGTWSVIDTATGSLTMVSPAKKSYATMTVDEFCAFLSGMMGGLSAEEKAMMQSFLKKQRPQNLKVKKAGSSGKVAGYSTDKYQILADGALYSEIWVSTDSRLKNAYQKMMKKALPMVNKMSSCSAASGGFDIENTKAYRQVEEKGWILKQIVRGQVVSEVVKLEQKKIPASEFKVPAGYKKTSLEQLFGG